MSTGQKFAPPTLCGYDSKSGLFLDDSLSYGSVLCGNANEVVACREVGNVHRIAFGAAHCDAACRVEFNRLDAVAAHFDDVGSRIGERFDALCRQTAYGAVFVRVVNGDYARICFVGGF